MKLLWDTKEKHIDVLKQTTWKTVLAVNGSYAVVVDHDDTRKKKDVCIKNLPDAECEQTEWFTIIFSPQGVICDLKYIYAEPVEKQRMLRCMQDFRNEFFTAAIEQQIEKKDFIRAEAVRRLWDSYSGDTVMRPLSEDDREVQKLLNSVKNQNVNRIGDFESAIYDLIIKYTMQLALYERSFTPIAILRLEKNKLSDKTVLSDLALKNKDLFQDESVVPTDLAKYIPGRFKKYKEQYLNMDEILEWTKAVHSNIYEELKLGDIEADTQVFFYPGNKCRGRIKVEELRKIQVTILGLIEFFLYYYAFDMCGNPKRALVEFSLDNGIISETKDYYADMSWFIIEKTSASVEIVLYNLIELNKGLEGKKDCEFQTVESIFDQLQVRLLPYLRTKSMEELIKPEEFNIVWEKIAENMWKKLQVKDGYSLLGRCFFHCEKNPRNAARKYWRKRIRHVEKGDFADKKKNLLQKQLTAKETLIVDKFRNFFSVQQKNLNTWDDRQKKKFQKDLNEYIEKMEAKG